MKQIHRIAILGLVFVLLLTAGCTKPAEPTNSTAPATTAPQETTVPTEPDRGAASLNGLRQGLVGTPQLFAAAWFGSMGSEAPAAPEDVRTTMQDAAPGLCADLPFLTQIPDARIVGDRGEAYCIVPAEENAVVTIAKAAWDEAAGEYRYENVVYQGGGEPIVVLCNGDGWTQDTRVQISTAGGEAVWYPGLDDDQCLAPLFNDDGQNRLFDFTPYRELLAARFLQLREGGWVMPTREHLTGTAWVCTAWTEDDQEQNYSLTFREEGLSVLWNDGDGANYAFSNAPWTLDQKEDYAVLTIDFGGFAGVLRFDLMYHEESDQLYFGMDVLQEDLPMGAAALYRTMSRGTGPDPEGLEGEWDRAWTEVEGYREEARSGVQTMSIIRDQDGNYRISHEDREFPEQSFRDKALLLTAGEMYYGCGNDRWMAVADYMDAYGTEYAVTLLDEDTLLLQQYWLMDGTPMVSYCWYSRIR